MADWLKLRDWEILRTLARLRYVTTRELVTAFFPSAAVGRRRLRKLADRDLITPHQKGVPTELGYRAWRLTPRGVDVTEQGFPDEVFPDGIAEKLERGSLLNLEHRSALTRLYLDLLCFDQPTPGDDGDLQALSARTHALRARAGDFWWQPDGDVVLRVNRLGTPLQKVPDATVCGRHEAVRVFVELDRSSRSLARIAEDLERYQMYLAELYAHEFPDRRQAVVLYVVRSEARRQGIHREAERILGKATRWDVLVDKAGGQGLAELLALKRGAADARSLPEDLRSAARTVYRWARAYQEALKGQGSDLPDDGQQALLELHRALRHERRHAG